MRGIGEDLPAMLRRLLQSISKLFNSVIRHHSVEREIQRWLDGNGYLGSSVAFHELDLYAIQAPGWLQVFRFRLQVKNLSRQEVQLFGVLRSDERFGASKIRVFDQMHLRDRQLEEWSTGLIVRRARTR